MASSLSSVFNQACSYFTGTETKDCTEKTAPLTRSQVVEKLTSYTIECAEYVQENPGKAFCYGSSTMAGLYFGPSRLMSMLGKKAAFSAISSYGGGAIAKNASEYVSAYIPEALKPATDSPEFRTLLTTATMSSSEDDFLDTFALLLVSGGIVMSLYGHSQVEYYKQVLSDEFLDIHPENPEERQARWNDLVEAVEIFNTIKCIGISFALIGVMFTINGQVDDEDFFKY